MPPAVPPPCGELERPIEGSGVWVYYVHKFFLKFAYMLFVTVDFGQG